MQFNKVNTLAGWTVCIIACTVYLLTMEPTVSFWDCGEFISSAYTLGIPHPPGAPLFLLIARLFIILFGADGHTAAIAVNSMSAIVSGLTILFLFWTITHLARKLVLPNDQPMNRQALFTIMSAGAVGALAYTFSDSFWFSAVEGEVYALSSLFTAIVFWAILKWERQADKPNADRWMVFIFYMMGLSIGIHLLNLLTIPAIIMVYFFKKYKATMRKTILALLIGGAITGFVLTVFIKYTMKWAGSFDVYFTNELGMPFFAGFGVFFALLAAVLAWTIRYGARKRLYYVQLGAWCCAFLVLGYCTYFTTMSRSNADPGVNLFGVNNPVKLESYTGREDYGDWPVFYGPDFTERAPFKKVGDLYVKGKDKYEVAGVKYKQDWGAAPSAHFFPRMYNSSNERGEIDLYRQFAGMGTDDMPTMRDNLSYFAKYQVGWMYMRYFLWNFAGKQNDLQGYGNPRDSNFITGFSFVDNQLYGNQTKMPDSVRSDNKGYNRLYMLPMLLGLAGLIFQYKRNRKDVLVTGLLFFSTGIAITIFLNQAGYQPRERDYAFVGSYYAFAIWIGLGVLWVKRLLEKIPKMPVPAISAAVLCTLAVPVLMASTEWDDHDRSDKTLAFDMAKNYLETCPPNAILFTYEDNDTYPLWYAQEVEGIRKDVRVVVTTMVGSDWYLKQLATKKNNSAAFPQVLTEEQVKGDRLNVAYYSALPGFDQNKYYDLTDMLKSVIASDDTRYTQMSEEGDVYHMFPVHKFSVPVNKQAVISSGLMKQGDQIDDTLKLDLGNKNFLIKNDLAVLSLIAANDWKRPICFTSTSSLNDIGLEKYTKLEGMVYRLTPQDNSNGNNVNTEVAYNNIMKHFKYGNTNKKGLYLDETNRSRLNMIKAINVQVAMALANEGKKEAARRILHHYDDNVDAANNPYGMTSNRGNFHNIVGMQFLQACYAADDKQLANKVAASLQKDLQQQLVYYRALGDETYNEEQLVNNAWQLTQGKGGELSERQSYFANDIVSSYQLLQQLEKWKQGTL